MGVAPDHFRGNGIHHVLKGEASVFLRHARVIDHLQQEIAELVLEPIEIASCDRIRDLIGFLDRVWRDRREGLLAIPRTARLGIPQSPHDAEQILDAIGPGRVVSHVDCVAQRRGAHAPRGSFP